VVLLSVDVETFRQRLLDERARVSEERIRLLEDTTRPIQDMSEDDDAHLADGASDTLEREIELTLEDNADHLLTSIDAALARIDNGTYGVCEVCGQHISAERLEALPYATKCIECKRREERG
jgi:RNA polymerase-binding transcription factor